MPGTIREAATTLGNNLLDAALSLAEAPYKGSPYQKLAGIRKLTLRPFQNFLSNVTSFTRSWNTIEKVAKILGSDKFRLESAMP